MTTPYTPGGTQPRPRKRRLVDVPYIGHALDYALSPWSLLSDLRARLMAHGLRIRRIEEKLMDYDEQITRGGQILALVKAEFASLREQLAAEEADDQAQVSTAVASARAADAERLGGLIDSLAEVLPVVVPDVEVPAAGEPAVIPETGETSDDVIETPVEAAPAAEAGAEGTTAQ